MLFQAGMGIGLVFWAVSEPVTHYTDPPLGLAQAETPFAIIMCLMCWCLYKTLNRDYREERQQVQETMAHDQNVEKQQMQKIMRRHEAGESVGSAMPNSSKSGMRKG